MDAEIIARRSRNQRGLFIESFLSLNSFRLLRFSAVKNGLGFRSSNSKTFLLRRNGEKGRADSSRPETIRIDSSTEWRSRCQRGLPGDRKSEIGSRHKPAPASVCLVPSCPTIRLSASGFWPLQRR
jgi:hypothetical protein